MTTFLSPAIDIDEVDLSHIPSTGSGVIPAFIGTAKKGPLNTPTYVTNTQECLDIFGEPIEDSSLMHAYLSYAQKANRGNAWILRVGIEYEAGLDDDLLDVCIDDSDKEYGYGRIALFKGIAKGQLCFREISTTNPVTFHDASVSNISFTGTANGALAFSSEDYTLHSDEVYTIQVTGDPTDPTNSNIHGATYKITNSSGTEIATGTFSDPDYDDTAAPITFYGLTFEASAPGTYPVATGDFWTFNVEPDNKTFSFSVDGGTATTYSFADGDSYTDATAFVAAINALIGAAAPYVAVVDTYACVRTDNYGERIQFMSTEAFGNETGLSIYAIDIPRASFTNTEPGSFTFDSNSNEFNLLVITEDANYEFDLDIPVGAYTITALATYLDSQSYYNGDKYWNAYTILYRETDGTDGYRLVIEADSTYEYSQLKIQADGTHPKVVKFVDKVGFSYPYTASYEAFYDSRVVLPTQSTSTPSQPASCDAGASSQCTVDTDYYENITGFIVTKYAGTWIDNYTFTLEPETTEESGSLFKIRIYKNGAEVETINNVGFDATDTSTYIANKINPGTSGGGASGNDYINWEERPSVLNNDSTDSSTYEARTPGAITNRSFTGGANGIPPSATYSSYLDAAIVGNQATGTGIYSLEDTDHYNITVLAIPGITSGSVITTAINFCQNRGECVYVLDPPFGLTPSQIVNWHNGTLSNYSVLSALDTSYAALYWSWVKWFNNFDGEYVYIPPSGFVIGAISYSEQENEVWYPAAGLNRGKLTTAIELEYSPTKSERDLLYGYDNAVNPLAKIANHGISIWGNRTLQRADSALDRLNVRLLVNEIKKRSVPTLRNFLFEFNDARTRARVKSLMETMMGEIAVGRGVTAYSVICDETNNTPARIDRNELWVSILFKPAKSIEFIQVKLGILSESQNIAMEEILAAAGVVI